MTHKSVIYYYYFLFIIYGYTHLTIYYIHLESLNECNHHKKIFKHINYNIYIQSNIYIFIFHKSVIYYYILWLHSFDYLIYTFRILK